MSECDTGSWTKYVGTYNGGYVVHSHVYQGLACVGFVYFQHDHPSSYGACKSLTTGQTHYANCWDYD